MSELRRGWWKVGRKVRNDSEGRYVRVREEEAQHVRDMAKWIEDVLPFVSQTAGGSVIADAGHDLLNRGTPPETEWLPEGELPDRPGRWQRKPTRWEGGVETYGVIHNLNCLVFVDEVDELGTIVLGDVNDAKREGFCWRRIGDL